MPPLPRCSGAECIAALRRLGFEVVRHPGGHAIMRRVGGGPTFPVPDHRAELKPKTLRSVLRLSGVTADELRGAL
jgi:predicted RNA binding protein YcfA (HicA-like mRNA interferase family)